MMEKMIDANKENTPDTPEEMEEMLKAHGYSLVPMEPEGAEGEEGMVDEEPVEEEAVEEEEGEEAPEDRGPEDKGGDESTILEDLMPMAAAGAPMNPHMKLRITTHKAAKHAVEDNDKKGKA
tara:strand:- start:5122 stop:5487 length:366 start_codon:yes stop_codon:yes gene_type:complete